MSFAAVRLSRTMSRAAFARLGAGSLAYVRVHRSEEVGFLHAGAPLLPAGRTVFVLHAADGCPLVVSESFESVVATAADRQLDAVSVH